MSPDDLADLADRTRRMLAHLCDGYELTTTTIRYGDGPLEKALVWRFVGTA